MDIRAKMTFIKEMKRSSRFFHSSSFSRTLHDCHRKDSNLEVTTESIKPLAMFFAYYTICPNM